MKHHAILPVSFLCALAGLNPAFAQKPVVSAGGVVNAASFVNGQPVAPGGVVAIFGTGLAASLAQADSVPWSTSLGNVSVTFNGVSAHLQFVSTGQINAQIPFDVFPTGAGTANVIVNNNGSSSAPTAVIVNPVAPGVFQFSGNALAINVTDPTSARYGTIAAPPGSIAGLTTFPARVNDFLFMYATGLGAVTPGVPNGGVPPTGVISNANVTPMCLVGNVPATVLFAGLSPGYPGIYQVNISVPQVPAGNAVPLQLQANGITSPAATTIAVQ